ncbi:hypothetical protein HME7025_02567 [Aquirufa nivalisilvae]|jgi:hypothetical protein|uniref:Uncharacterized protein n=1 Tax=Aquirufa nivalisilvae TaxID=2516557 RepID=A0A2S2E068_9BACT|nr:hypothetical protein HME7025_02567 [Aquirufa nivalisilvae]
MLGLTSFIHKVEYIVFYDSLCVIFHHLLAELNHIE